MTRTLFVGEPSARDLEIYALVARAQGEAIATLERAVTEDALVAERHGDRRASHAA